jgi:hypothetical protein
VLPVGVVDGIDLMVRKILAHLDWAWDGKCRVLIDGLSVPTAFIPSLTEHRALQVVEAL